MSWNGLITASVWCRNSVSASSMPARNAAQRHRQPERVRRPGAADSATNSTVSVKVSVLRWRAISRNSGRSSQRPSTSTSSSASDRAPDHAEQPRGAQHVAGRAERGGEREQRREREVLEQQDADRQPRVRAVDLELLAELAHDDRGRGHGERAAEHDRDRRVDAERPGRAAERGRREQHLQAADAEHLGLHRDHAGERELEAEREDQEHDADLGEQRARPRRRRRGPSACGPERPCRRRGSRGWAAARSGAPGVSTATEPASRIRICEKNVAAHRPSPSA